MSSTNPISLLMAFALSPVLCADPTPPPRAVPVAPTDKVENKVAPESEKSIRPQPVVKKISPDVYQIGKIKLNKKTKEITFQATTNIVNPDSILEYLIVRKEGEKVHESLLITEADPQNLNIALKLLGYKESKELFRIPKPDGTPSDKYIEVPEATRKAARFSIEVTTETDGKTTTVPVSKWVYHRVLAREMPEKAWIYNGSYVHRQKFKAHVTGNFFAIFTDYGAVANYPGDGRYDDTLWYPHKNVPDEGTKVTVSLKPWKK